jgi:hypothetical protein
MKNDEGQFKKQNAHFSRTHTETDKHTPNSGGKKTCATCHPITLKNLKQVFLCRVIVVLSLEKPCFFILICSRIGDPKSKSSPFCSPWLVEFCVYKWMATIRLRGDTFPVVLLILRSFTCNVLSSIWAQI